ncbi:MAG: hypothetical protein ACREBG_09160 [Pyrinomonadaceae bacterium]
MSLVRPVTDPDEFERIWKALDVAVAELPKSGSPPGAFTSAEFAARRGNMSQDSAYKLLRKLIKARKVEQHKQGAKTYYILVEDTNEG